MAQTGRPPKEFKSEVFEALCRAQCTLGEIAEYMGMSEDSIESKCFDAYGKGFSDIFKQKRRGGYASLRRRQYEVALKGNPAMLIWLGKQWLKQSDKQDVNIGNQRKPFKFVAVKKEDDES
jgi:hypothetical protein